MAEEGRRAGGGGIGGVGLPPGGIRGSYYEEKKSVLGSEEIARAKRVVLKSADMKEEMQKEVINCALSAFDKHAVEKDIAEYIKKEFDNNHGPTWHCIVGLNFVPIFYKQLATEKARKPRQPTEATERPQQQTTTSMEVPGSHNKIATAAKGSSESAGKHKQPSEARVSPCKVENGGKMRTASLQCEERLET